MIFIKKIIQATGELDTLMYLNSPSFESAMSLWIKDLASEIKSLIETIDREDMSVTAENIIDLKETFLEKKHIKYLEYLLNFEEKIDFILARKAAQYAKICNKLDKSKTKSKKFKNEIIKKEGIPYLEQLDIALSLLSKFSKKHLIEIEKRKIQNLSKYKKLYLRLKTYSNLDRVSFLTALLEKGEI